MGVPQPTKPVPKIPLAAVAVALGAGLLGGCATAPPDPYRALPAAPPPAAVAMAHPAVPTGDPALDAFLADLAASVDRQAWRAAAEAFDADAYAEAVAEARPGAGSDQAAAVAVVARALGLSDVFGAASPSLDALNQIRVVTFRQAARQPDGSARVTGDVRLQDGRTVPLAFEVRQGGAGRYRVAVPAG